MWIESSCPSKMDCFVPRIKKLFFWQNEWNRFYNKSISQYHNFRTDRRYCYSKVSRYIWGSFGPFQGNYTEIWTLVSPGPAIFFNMLPFWATAVKFFQMEILPPSFNYFLSAGCVFLLWDHELSFGQVLPSLVPAARAGHCQGSGGHEILLKDCTWIVSSSLSGPSSKSRALSGKWWAWNIIKWLYLNSIKFSLWSLQQEQGIVREVVGMKYYKGLYLNCIHLCLQ